MRSLLLLVLIPVAAAQPSWDGWEHDWSFEDEIDDPARWPVMAPGADLHVLSATLYEDVLYWHMALVPADDAVGDYFYQVFWTIADTRYATAADITWAAGEPLRVEASGRGGGRIGEASWDAATHALVFSIGSDLMEAPAQGTPVEVEYALAGQSLGPTGDAGFWDDLEAYETFLYGGPVPAPPAPAPSTSTPTADAPMPLLSLVAISLAYSVRRRSLAS